MTHLAICFRALEHWVELAGYAEDEHTGESREMIWELSYPDYVRESQASIEMQRRIGRWADETGADYGLIDCKPSLLRHIASDIIFFAVDSYFPNYDRDTEPSAMAAAKQIVKSRINKP